MNSVSGEIRHLMRDKGYPQKRAVAASYNMARKRGMDVPPKPAKRKMPPKRKHGSVRIENRMRAKLKRAWRM